MSVNNCYCNFKKLCNCNVSAVSSSITNQNRHVDYFVLATTIRGLICLQPMLINNFDRQFRIVYLEAKLCHTYSRPVYLKHEPLGSSRILDLIEASSK
jgi:hypothetical protein